MTYSIDFSKKVLSIKAQNHLTSLEVSNRLGIGQATVVRGSKPIEPQRTRQKPTIKFHGEALTKEDESGVAHDMPRRPGYSPLG